jgi:hypothetical protein
VSEPNASRPRERIVTPSALSPQQVAERRYLGCEGGFILNHRALLRAARDPLRYVAAALLAAVIWLLWCLILDWVSAAWATMLDFWRAVVGLPGYVTLVHYRFGDFLPFDAPALHTTASLPSNDAWWIGTVATVLVVLASFLIPDRWLPIRYFVRILAFFQACAQLYFAFWAEHFPYGPVGYIHTLLIASLMLISLVPIVLGFSYFIFDFRFRYKIALTVMIIAHQFFMIPMQYVFHAYVIHHLSLLVLPLLYFIVGLPLNVLIFIAFYAWGFSWKDELHAKESRRRKPRKATPRLRWSKRSS